MKIKITGRIDEARIISVSLKKDFRLFLTKGEYDECSQYFNQIIQSLLNIGSTESSKAITRFVSVMQSSMAKIHIILRKYNNSLSSNIVTNLRKLDQIVKFFQKRKDFGKHSEYLERVDNYSATFMPYGECFSDVEFVDRNI